MEEQKNNSKEVEMQPMIGKKQDNTKQPELTMEQLKELADKLFNENRYLRHQLQQANEYANAVNRLDYLFKVVDSYNPQKTGVAFSLSFVEKCVQEIEKIMTIPENEQTTEDNKKN